MMLWFAICLGTCGAAPQEELWPLLEYLGEIAGDEREWEALKPTLVGPTGASEATTAEVGASSGLERADVVPDESGAESTPVSGAIARSIDCEPSLSC